MQQNATDSIASGEVAGAEILPFGEELAGRYEIREVLGVGGYAVVYRAYDRELRSEVALKVLRNDRSSPAAIARFRREATVARDAASPHLVRIFDIVVSGGNCFLAMELVRGESLRQRIARGALPVHEAIAVSLQILKGLAALHAVNIVHRDLKPENVLVSDDCVVKLADFGLAYYLDDEHSRATATGAVVGTSDYLSPEQVLGSNVDARSDLYAFGIVLFEMLSGRLPFPRQSSIGAMLARLRTPAPSIRSIRKDVPYWLSTIIRRLLEKNASSRFAHVSKVIQVIEAKRADWRNAVRPRFLFSVAAIAVLITVWWLAPPPQHPTRKFARLEPLGDRGFAAVDTNGKPLWQRTNMDSQIASTYALARIEADHPPRIATILGGRNDFSAQRMQILSFIDPLTGEVVRRAHLSSAAAKFQHTAARFLPRSIVAVDLDHDGVDEILITFQHVPEAPSYTVLYEPMLDRARVVFEADGHHDIAAVHDIDGDGKADLLLLGINNGVGWANALAAVRINPWIGSLGTPNAAGSPDFVVNSESLLWYALLPRGRLPTDAFGTLSFDDIHHRLNVKLATGRNALVGYDGFLLEAPSKKSPGQRQELRRAAWTHYRESQRLFAGGFLEDSVAEVQNAVESATAADEPLLIERMQCSLGKMLIANGQIARGEQLLEAIADHSEDVSEVAFDAAVALHLRGEIERAVTWYTRGAGKGGSLEGGKSKHEFLQGIVLGDAELARWQDALTAVDRFATAYSWNPRDWTALYREFIRWRSGQRPSLAGVSISPNAIDLVRYWVLEFRNANGEDPRPLLHEVEDLITIGDDPQCVLWSLKAELLWKVGRREEAAAAIRKADELLESDRRRSVVARAHAAVITERFARMTRERI